MDNQLLAGKGHDRPAAPDCFPTHVNKGCIIGQRADGPLGVCRADIVGITRFSKAIENTRREATGNPNVGRQPILIGGLRRIRRRLGVGNQGTGPNGGGAAGDRTERGGEAKAYDYLAQFHFAILFPGSMQIILTRFFSPVSEKNRAPLPGVPYERYGKWICSGFLFLRAKAGRGKVQSELTFAIYRSG